MIVEQLVMKKIRHLPLDKQQEVLDFVEFLEHKAMPKQPRQSVKGLWADLNVEIQEEDIAEIRDEMWQNFPREDILE